jgi:hypothetical protein
MKIVRIEYGEDFFINDLQYSNTICHSCKRYEIINNYQS